MHVRYRQVCAYSVLSPTRAPAARPQASARPGWVPRKPFNHFRAPHTEVRGGRDQTGSHAQAKHEAPGVLMQTWRVPRKHPEAPRHITRRRRRKIANEASEGRPAACPSRSSARASCKKMSRSPKASSCPWGRRSGPLRTLPWRSCACAQSRATARRDPSRCSCAAAARERAAPRWGSRRHPTCRCRAG